MEREATVFKRNKLETFYLRFTLDQLSATLNLYFNHMAENIKRIERNYAKRTPFIV